MDPTGHSVPTHAERTIWLSGELLTLLNKLVFPTVWLAILTGVALSVFFSTGQVELTGGFRILAVLVLLGTGFMLWMTFRIQRVGYAGGELIVANYWHEIRIAFEDIQAVEAVWWYRTRVVRIRFRKKTSFGSLVYYLPKWGFDKRFAGTPEQELRDLLMQSGVPT